MEWDELVGVLDRLIDYESQRIKEVFPKTLADATTAEYRDSIGLMMRYIGKRDAYTYIKHLLQWGKRSPVWGLVYGTPYSLKRQVDGEDWTEEDRIYESD